ncbi:MAG: NAD(P)/FAD-dependent oxidoreductase, partial [Arenicellales bacterium]
MVHKFIVVGAGIVGATIAYHLARSGHAVSVYDSGRQEARATQHSFGWINASFYIDANHHRLRAASLVSWRQLQHDIQSESIRWPGCLCFEHSGDQLEAQYNALQTLDYECEIMATSEIRTLCPNLPTLPTTALWLPQEGVAQSDRLTSELLHAATRAGASLNTLHPVERLLERNGRVCGVQT